MTAFEMFYTVVANLMAESLGNAPVAQEAIEMEAGEMHFVMKELITEEELTTGLQAARRFFDLVYAGELWAFEAPCPRPQAEQAFFRARMQQPTLWAEACKSLGVAPA